VIPNRPLSAEDVETSTLADLRLVRDMPGQHTTADFLAAFKKAQEKWWDHDPEYVHWQDFFEDYPMPTGLNRLIVFDQGSPMAAPNHLMSRCASMMRRYAQMVSMQRWMSIRSGREVHVFLQSQLCLKQDAEALKTLDINLVDGSYGAHEGFALIDQDTVVIDFNSLFPVRRIACEGILPAIIICLPAPAIPDPDVPFFVVRDREVNDGGDLVLLGHVL